MARVKQRLAIGLLLALGVGGVVAAETYYVSIRGARLLDKPDEWEADEETPLDVNAQVIFDGELDFEEGRAQRENRFIKVEVPSMNGKEGYIKTSALWRYGNTGVSFEESSERAASGAEGAGAAARGFTQEIEEQRIKDDKEFAIVTQKLNQLEAFINKEFRASPNGSYERADPSAIKRELKPFAKKGGLR